MGKINLKQGRKYRSIDRVEDFSVDENDVYGIKSDHRHYF